MLSKLLKYDLKYMLKSMSIFYILSIFFAITTRILFSLEQTVVINVIGQISVGTMISMMASTLINTLMRSWIRFKESIYGDESYLTHTLPVNKNTIYQSKFLLTFIYTLVAFIVIIAGLFIAYYTDERWLMLKELINNIGGSLNISTLPFVASVIVVLFLEIFNIIQSGFLGIILGHKKGNNKIALSVLFGFITYIITQNFAVIAIFISGVFNKDIMSLFTSSTIQDVNIIKTIVSLAAIIYLAINILVNIICVKFLKTGVNVE